MKLVSWNVNGIRAAHRKGFLEWFASAQPDVLCLQEVKAFSHQVPAAIGELSGFHVHWHAAERPGYAGVATFSREAPRLVRQGLGHPEMDVEGRLLLTEFEAFSLVNVYIPHARRDLSRLAFKMEYCERFLEWTENLRQRGKPIIVCGDLNTAHRPKDLANPTGNKRNAGFLPVERAWLDRFLGLGLRDNFRDFCGEGGHYTWWSNRKGVRERNVGWRIDYFCADEALRSRVTAAYHLPGVHGSDHCPVVLELDLASGTYR